MLSKLCISPQDLGDVTLSEIKENPSFTLLCSDVNLSSIVDVYGGMMSEFSTLIHIGDFVKYLDSNSSRVIFFFNFLHYVLTTHYI